MQAKRRWRWIAVVAIPALLIAVFLPEVLAAGWHLLCGDSARFREWNIPVPAGWYAITRGEALAVEKMRRISLWRGPSTVVFLPLHAGPRYVFDYDTWQATEIQILSKKGYQMAEARSISLAGQPGFCWGFVHNADARKSWITCIVPRERLTADFIGDRAHISGFYSLLGRVTRSRSRD